MKLTLIYLQIINQVINVAFIHALPERHKNIMKRITGAVEKMEFYNCHFRKTGGLLLGRKPCYYTINLLIAAAADPRKWATPYPTPTLGRGALPFIFKADLISSSHCRVPQEGGSRYDGERTWTLPAALPWKQQLPPCEIQSLT